MGNTNKPKKQHFLPQMFLEGFTTPNRQIYFLDKQTGKTQLRNPKTIAAKNDLYTIHKQDSPLFNVEELFSKIESDSTSLFKKIRETGFNLLNDEQLKQLVEFIVIIFNRTPLATNAAENILNDPQTLNEMREKGDDANTYIKAMSENKGLSFAITLQQHLEYRHGVISKNFDAYLLTAPEGAPPFIINDRFACLEMRFPETPWVLGQPVDWSQMNVNMHFPISNKHCVAFVPKVDRTKVGTKEMLFTKKPLSLNDTNVINWLSLNQAERYAYCSNEECLIRRIQPPRI